MALWSTKRASSPTTAGVVPEPNAPALVPAPESAPRLHLVATGENQSTAQPPSAALAVTPGEPAKVVALSSMDLARRRAVSKQVAATFGEIVNLLLRQPATRSMTLQDLERLVLPPLMAEQVVVVEAQSTAHGYSSPVGVILWARVSEAVDERLSSSLDQPIRLAATEWTSGDIIWLIEAIGENTALKAAIAQLTTSAWRGRAVKVRATGPDGKASVRTIGVSR